MVDLDCQLDWLRDAPVTSDSFEGARGLDPKGSSLMNESSHSMTLSLFVDGDSRECGLEGGYRSLGHILEGCYIFVLVLFLCSLLSPSCQK